MNQNILSSAGFSGRDTPSLPPIDLETMQNVSTEYPPIQNKRLAPKGKSGIPVYSGRKTPSMNGVKGQSRNANLNRSKSFDGIDRNDRNFKDMNNRYRGSLSRAGNHPRMSRAYSDHSPTRLPPISPGRRAP